MSKYNTELLRKRHTPVLCVLDDLISDGREDPPLPEDLLDIPDPIYLAPRYYLKIFSPSTYNSNSSISSRSLIHHIPRSGILAGTLQLLLRPSVGYGINSCYRVEYWEWEKFLLPRGYSLSGHPTKNRLAKDKPQYPHRFIKEEHWYIPSADGSININYDSFYSNQGHLPHAYSYPYLLPKRKGGGLSSFTIMRADSNFIHEGVDYFKPPHHLEVFDVVSITSLEDGNEWQDFSVTKIASNSPLKSLTGEEVTQAVGIGWGTAAPRPSSYYELTYVKPFLLEDLIFIEERASTLHPTRSINNGHPWIM
jgi:hypothetical protein